MRDTIFPVYVVIDFSGSMAIRVDGNAGKQRIDIASDIIPTLLKSMEKSASVAESLRVRVIGFNAGIVFCTELMDYEDLSAWYERDKKNFASRCAENLCTWYGSAFDKLYECINDDVSSIVQNKKEFMRPLVYFITDGKPEKEDDNEREKQYKKLVSNPISRRRPVILCIGIGDEDMRILKRYGASRLGTKNNEYITGNERMTFIIKKGIKSGTGLEFLNGRVVDTIKFSLQSRPESSDEVGEIDDRPIRDPDILKRLSELFDTADNLSY